VISATIFAGLLVWILRKNRPSGRTLWKGFLAPLLVVLVAAGAAMAYYNWRVFGNPLTLPYQINRATYAVSPYFLWQSPRPEPAYHHHVMRDFYVSMELPVFQAARTAAGFLDGIGTRILIVLFFYLGPPMFLPLTMLHKIRHNRRLRFLVVAVAIFSIAMMANAFVSAHYLAPATALIYAMVLAGARYLRHWSPGGRPVGACLIRVLPCACVAIFLAQLGVRAATPARDLPRTRLEHFLERQPGHHLVFVRYAAGHSPHD
jgi:hypothetical protein